MSVTLNFDTSTNKDLLRGGLRKLFDDSTKDTLFEADRVFNMVPTDEYIERDAHMGTFSGHTSLTDGQAIPMDDPVFDTTKDYTQSRYGTGFKITDGMKRFNKVGLVKKLTKGLGQAMKEAKDVDVADIYNSATSTYTGFDGLNLASNSHTTLGGGGTTYDNYGNAALSLSALEDATIYFDTLVDDLGETRPLVPTDVVVAPELRFTLTELIGSPDKPTTADRAINALRDQFELSPFIYHRLTSSTSWFVLAKGDEDFDIKVFTAQEPDMEMQDAPDTSRSIQVTSQQWYTKGFGVPKHCYMGNS